MRAEDDLVSMGVHLNLVKAEAASASPGGLGLSVRSAPSGSIHHLLQRSAHRGRCVLGLDR